MIESGEVRLGLSEAEGSANTETRQRLLLAAEEVFAAKGYDAASVREICKRAQANVAAINYHFGDKETLYVESVKYAHACSMAQSHLFEHHAETNPKDQLVEFIRSMVRAMHGPIRPSSLQLLMRELSHPSPASTAVVKEYIQPMAHGLGSIIQTLLPDVDKSKRMMICFSIVGQALYYRQNRVVSQLLFGHEAVDALDVNKVTEHILQFTLAALGLGPPINSDYHAEDASHRNSTGFGGKQ